MTVTNPHTRNQCSNCRGYGGDFPPTTHRRPWHYNSSTCVTTSPFPLEGITIEKYPFSMPLLFATSSTARNKKKLTSK